MRPRCPFPGFILRDAWLRQAPQDEGCVPRMLRSAKRCAADPGSIVHSASPWVPALRCIVKNAAPRPGHGTHCFTLSQDEVLVSVRRVLESYESSVIQEWWPDSRRGHRCGRARTAPATTAASCDIPAI